MKRLVQNQVLPAAIGAVLLLLVVGCNRNGIKVYHVETNDVAIQPPPPAASPANSSSASSGAMPTTMPNGLPVPDKSALPSLKYTVPKGWQEKTPSEMRVASFGVTENGRSADVSVIPLGGMGGGDLANVNRWRGQVGLQPLPNDDLQKLAEKVEVAGQSVNLYDLAGTSPGSGNATRILGVILHRNDTSWFFKVDGDSDLVEKEKPAFISFLKSVQFTGSAATAAMDMSQLPPSHPAIPGMASSAASGEKPIWTVPSNWQTGQLEQFLTARYVIAGANGAEADVNVSSLAGNGGGLLPNVNRWRGQLGLDPVDNAGMTKNISTLNTSAGQATAVDISGTDAQTGKPARLIGVVLPLNGHTWFYKLMGDPGVVVHQKSAFLQFVQSAKYPDVH